MTDTAIEQQASLPPELQGMDTGLEDFDTTDMVMPRLSIVGDEVPPMFADNLTGEKFTELEVVLLGLVKQRILWPAEMGDGNSPPLCKSYEFHRGFPNREDFPLDASGFDELPAEGESLPCDSCALKEWGSHPKTDTPWCSEQHTFPLLMRTGEGGPFNAPAILTVQRSALKSSKSYLTGFARSKTPLFTVITRLTLDPMKRGSVKYAVPRFAKVDDSEREEWGEYAEHYRTIRGFISTPPPDAGEDNKGDSEPPTSSAGTSQAAASANTDDDLPF